MKKTVKVVLESIKDPDGWGQLIDELGLSEAKRKRYFEWCEYADIEIEVDEDMNIVGGKILKNK